MIDRQDKNTISPQERDNNKITHNDLYLTYTQKCGNVHLFWTNIKAQQFACIFSEANVTSHNSVYFDKVQILSALWNNVLSCLDWYIASYQGLTKGPGGSMI